MPDFSAWMGITEPDANWLSDDMLASFAARLIARKPSEITVKRRGASDITQTVRVDMMSTGSRDASGGNANPATVRAVIIGYKDHPTEDDTDLQRADRFLLDGVEYEVIQVLPSTPYQLQAIAEAVER